MTDDGTPVLDQIRAHRHVAEALRRRAPGQTVDDPHADDPAFDSDFYEDV